MSIVHYEQFSTDDGIEVVVENATKLPYFTINGYARMSGRAKSTISDRVKACSEKEIKEAEIETGYGLKLVRLIPAKLAFRWAIKDNPELAERMGECGASVYAYQLVGYRISIDDPNDRRKGIDPASEIDLAGYALDVAFSGVGLNPGLLAGLKLNAFSAVHPQLRGYLNEGHKLIAATNTIEGELLSPTAIGKKMGISARQVNVQLIKAGLQEENPNYGKYGHKREPRYLPTDRGREFCEVTLATGRNTSTSFQQIKWYESVVEAIA